jgi:hypothetical protein
LVDGDALTDSAGNPYAGISSTTALSFTTVAAGTTATTYSVVVESNGAWIDTNANGVKNDGETTAFANSGEYTLAEDTVTIEFNNKPDIAINLAGFGIDDLLEIDVTAWLTNEAGWHTIAETITISKTSSSSAGTSYSLSWINIGAHVSGVHASTSHANDGLYIKKRKPGESLVSDNTAIAVWDNAATAALDPGFVNTAGNPLNYITLVNIPTTD